VRPLISFVGSLAVAVFAGIAWGLCFASEPLAVAPWVALVPAIALLGRPRPGWLGFVHGLSFWLLSIGWVVPTMVTYGGLSTWLAVLGLILLASYLAIFSALFGWLGSGLWRSGGLQALVGLPALWVVLELLRGWLLTGFPWNLAAYSWIDVIGALPVTAWIGPWGLSFVVVLVNVAAARALLRRRWSALAGTLGLVILVLIQAARWGAEVSSGETPFGNALEVRIVQPNIENLIEWDEDQVHSNYRRLFELSREACDALGALVIWPESAAWPYSYTSHAGFRNDVDLFTRTQCALLFNSTLKTPDGDYNAAMLAANGALAGRYDKRHLVPFGEYVPMASWLPFLDKVARNAGDFKAGSEMALLPLGSERIGTSICFEVTFPGQVAEQVRAGAGILATLTNDAWYGDTAAPWQHYRAARFRAAENRRYLVRAAITGVSAIIGPGGESLGRLDVGEIGVLSGRIVGRQELGFYTRMPWLVPTICWLLAGFAIFRSRTGGQA